jgi:hypothetical protein
MVEGALRNALRNMENVLLQHRDIKKYHMNGDDEKQLS